MVFQSFDYVLGFLPLLLALYLVVRRSRLASTVVLVVGSAIFYAWKTAWWLIRSWSRPASTISSA